MNLENTAQINYRSNFAASLRKLAFNDALRPQFFNRFVTVNLNRAYAYPFAKKLLRSIDQKLNQRLVHRRFYRQRHSERRIRYIAFPELSKFKSNSHFHLLTRVHEDVLNRFDTISATKAAKAAVNSATVHVEPIAAATEIDISSYSQKDAFKRPFEDDFILSQEFHYLADSESPFFMSDMTNHEFIMMFENPRPLSALKQ